MNPWIRELSDRPVTLGVMALAVATYLLWGAAERPEDFTTLPQLLLGILRHGSVQHLSQNIVLLAIGGAQSERHLGSKNFALLALICAVLATWVEVTIAGPGFVGLSGLAYGLVAFGVMWDVSAKAALPKILMLAAVLLAERFFLNTSVAIFGHATAIIIGGGSAMLGAFFGTKGPVLRPMEWKHVTQAVAIIAETDEDDAHEAEQVFLNGGYERMSVLIDRGHVLGLTGYDIDAQVPDVAWLSWTYLGQEYQNEGLGSKMMNELLGKLAKMGIRKVFIETSDYAENGVPIYASAHKMYEDFGAEVELTLPDYHAIGEAKIIYGLDNPEAAETPKPESFEDDGLSLTGYEIAAETRDVAGITWEEAPSGLRGADFVLQKALAKGNRYAVLSIPSDLSSVNTDALINAGFRQVGALKRYYGSHRDQHWWVGS